MVALHSLILNSNLARVSLSIHHFESRRPEDLRVYGDMENVYAFDWLRWGGDEGGGPDSNRLSTILLPVSKDRWDSFRHKPRCRNAKSLPVLYLLSREGEHLYYWSGRFDSPDLDAPLWRTSPFEPYS